MFDLRFVWHNLVNLIGDLQWAVAVLPDVIVGLRQSFDLLEVEHSGDERHTWSDIFLAGLLAKLLKLFVGAPLPINYRRRFLSLPHMTTQAPRLPEGHPIPRCV